MADKRNSKVTAGDKSGRKKSSMSPEARSRRIQAIMFGVLAVVMVFSMIISLVAR